MATPPAGTKLSLGKLGRATAVGNSDYTSKTSLNSAARDSSTGKTSLSDFYISAVDSTLDGYPYVDEQTNEIYELTFTNNNSLFASRIAARADNFTWTTSNSDLFALQSSATRIAQYNAGAIADNTTPAGITMESNLVTNPEFENWASAATPDDWTKSGTVSENTSGATGSAVQFESDGAYIEQSFTVKGNSTYQIYTSGKSANAGNSNFDITISGSQDQNTYVNTGTGIDWTEFREDFYTSGSAGATQTLKLKFEANIIGGVKPSLDTVRFQRWEGAHMSDTDVTITGKYWDAGETNGFNDHADNYNTAISKVVEIQDTYAGLTIACFLPGTMIKMADGTEKDIEEVSVGDKVLSVIIPDLPDEDLGYHEWKTFSSTDDMSSLEASSATVEKIFYDYMDGYWNVNDGLIKVTEEHDLWTYTFTDNSGDEKYWKWRKPSQLQIGQSLLDHEGNLIEVTSIEKIEEEVEVVNIDVEPLDVYFAGGVLVHNKGASSDPGS